VKYFLLSAFIFCLGCACGNNSPAKTADVKIGVSEFLSEKQFDDLFPLRDKFYSYAAFIKAIKEMSFINVKVVRRATSVYQFTRTDKRTGKPVVVRQDPDWNEDWAKKKPDSSYIRPYSPRNAAWRKRKI